MICPLKNPVTLIDWRHNIENLLQRMVFLERPRSKENHEHEHQRLKHERLTRLELVPDVGWPSSIELVSIF